MESFATFFQFVSDKDFSVPLWEVGVLAIINSICLLFGRNKTGLIITYLFVFYWGFILNKDYFIDILGRMSWGLYVYGICGVLMAIIAIISFFVRSRHV